MVDCYRKITKEQRIFMSILNVEHLSHGFGDRAIFQDVSFRLLKGEHIGLIGANGEGKSTFMSIITGKKCPCRILGSAYRTEKGNDCKGDSGLRFCISV